MCFSLLFLSCRLLLSLLLSILSCSFLLLIMRAVLSHILGVLFCSWFERVVFLLFFCVVVCVVFVVWYDMSISQGIRKDGG